MTKPRVAVALCGVGVAVAALAGCSKSDLTPVKAAGDSSTTTSTSVTTSTQVESSTPPSSAPASTPTVAAPSNALTMSCTEFMGLDQATKQAVTTEVIAGNRTIVNPNNTSLAVVLAEAMCTHEPNSTVNTALGGPPA
ncbi:hypothetical protein [Gordonia malaquae]|jgi:hypothetical protein|uniref:hypothetical protein n=1 Tax=Gordonia malaquae TaxID=410332 RepID=UPI00301B02C4